MKLKQLTPTLLTFVILLLTSTFALAQEVGDMVGIKMKTGGFYKGKVIQLSETIIELDTKDFGAIDLLRSDIREIKYLTKPKSENDIFWNPSLTSTHYFLGASGYSLAKGEMEYQNIYILFNSFSYGVTDQLTLGAGVELLGFLFNSSSFSSFNLTGKYAFPIQEDKFNVSVNGMIIHTQESNHNIGILYGANTIGNRDSHVTFGLGFIISDGITPPRPLINLSGVFRTGEKFSLLSEIWTMPPIYQNELDSFRTESKFSTAAAFGGRHIGRSLVIDFALLINNDEDIAIPWISLTLPIRKKN